ncbi:FG-GAP repeat domain-containing protein [Streptomyces mirabilis]|uniref:FG-GAP repeat domain-containing protein n=1 Tax=Streptomyces mirabilis TaxID=68239 RepID=UPI0037A5D0C2
MRTRWRSRAIVAGSIGALTGLLPLPTAAADTLPPTITAGVSGPDSGTGVSLYGAPGDIHLRVGRPPTQPAYIRLIIQPTAGQNAGLALQIADAAGNILASRPGPTAGSEELDLGTSPDGTATGPLQAGTTDLKVSVTAPMADAFQTNASIIDGNTGQDLADSHSPSLRVFEPLIETSAGSNDAYWGPDAPATVVGGATAPVRTKLFVDGRQMQTAIPRGHLTLTLTAAQLAAAGLTARQLASSAHFTLDASTTALPWTIGPDGSLSVGFPGFDLPAPSNNNLDPTWQGVYDLAATLGVHPGTVAGTLRLEDSAGRQFTTSQVAIRFADPDPHDLTLDRKPDLLARDKTGALWLYPGTGKPNAPLGQRVNTDRYLGWSQDNALVVPGIIGPWNRAGLLVRNASTGRLDFYQTSGAGLSGPTHLAGNWNTYPLLVGAGDLTGDHYGDLLARDKTGALWLYPGAGTTAVLGTRIKIGTGWGAYNTVIGAGDLTGDSKADVFARDSQGALWLYPGTGSATKPLGARIQVGTGWGAYNALVGIGDLTGDGKPDLVARDKTGTLWLYPGTSHSTRPFAGRIKIGTGWSAYNTIL